MFLSVPLLLLFLAGPVLAQPAVQPGPAAPVSTEAAALEPPQAVSVTEIAYPADAPPHDQPVTVRVRLRVGPDGQVQKVDLLEPGLAAFDRVVVEAARAFRFSPARYGGKPVTVDITYAHTFVPPALPGGTVAPTAEAARPRAVLSGRLREKGTRLPVVRAEVKATVSSEVFTAESDQRGRFRLEVLPGKARVTVHGQGYLDFLQVEQLKEGEELRVAYLVERSSYDPYEIVVYSEQRRTEISRTTLRGRELTQIPGTFGDPFRVVQTMPGVASVIALLPYPIVRGASPGSTGFLIDGVRVPLLYHLLAGPSVIHPAFVDEIAFYPGGFPVSYGGYTAGIIDGRTRRARSDETLYDVDLNLAQTGGLVRRPLPWIGATATAAGRVGYPGLLMSLATDEASLSYWDYQVRLDGGSARHGWTVFAFGASDEVSALPEGGEPGDPLEPMLRFSFHRLDLRYLNTGRDNTGTYRLVLGLDDTLMGVDLSLRTLLAEPRLHWRLLRGDALEFRCGLDGLARETTQDQSQNAAAGMSTGTSTFTEDLSKFYSGAAWVEALWRPVPDLLLRPGVRTDLYYDGNTTAPALDPRLSLRYRLWAPSLPAEATATASDDDAAWLKGGIGLFHQPPRFFLPIPGLDTMPLRYGLLAAVQTTVGAELPLGAGLSLDTALFFNWMDPVIFDLEINQEVEDLTQQAPTRMPGTVPEDTGDSENGFEAAMDDLFKGQLGRACGLELMIRRQARSGLYGWLSYTLSLSERKRSGEWVAFDFDRTHLLNLVAGLPLPRNWEVGARLQYQSGKPATTTYGYNTARTEGYMRIDLRIDKRAVWRKWLLDFYVDLGNAILFPEEVATGAAIRYVIPTVGFRARL